MMRNKQQSASQIDTESELSIDAHLHSSIKKIARLRSNLKALQIEISEKILNGVKECRESCGETLEIVSDLNASLTGKK